MGPLGYEKNRGDYRSREKNLSVDLREKATQRIDSHNYPGAVVEDVGHDDFIYLYDTMPVDDTCLMEDSFETQLVDLAEETQLVDPAEETQLVDLADETQLVDLAGETQLVDLAEETQVVDFAGETQLLDLAGKTQVIDDLDCVKNMELEFLNNIDTTNKMEDLCEETQVLSQDDSDDTDGSGSVQLEDTVGNRPPAKQGDSACRTPSGVVTDEEHHSGSVSRGFTSIRAASIRASGMAASAQGANRGLCNNVNDIFTSIRTASIRASGLAASARGANGGLCNNINEKTSIEQERCNQDNSPLVGSLLEFQKLLGDETDGNSEELKNSNKCKVRSTAMRKLFSENDDAEHGFSDDDVDHVTDNLDMPELPASENCLAGLSYADSQEPGELSQAHALEVVDKFLDLNAMELEEGFGTRVRHSEKLNVISGGRGSLNLAKSSIFKSIDAEHGIYDWDNTREDDGGGHFFQKKKELFFDKGVSEPGKGRHPRTGCIEPPVKNGDGKEEYMKNKSGGTVHSDSRLMLHNLRAKRNSVNCRANIVHRNVVKNLNEQLDWVSGHELEKYDTCKDVPDMITIGPDTQMAAEAMENLCFEVQLDDSNNNIPDKGTRSVTKGTNRKSKRRAPSKEQPTTETSYPTRAGVTRQAKRNKRVPDSASNEFSILPNQSKKIRKKHEAVVGVAEQRKPAEMESTGPKSAARSDLKEQLDSSTPVAKRTRKCTELNRPTAATNSSDAREVINDLISSRVLRKKRTATNHKNVKIITIEQLKRMGLAARNQSKKASSGTFSALNVDAVGGGQGKGSQQETMVVEREVDTHGGGRFKRPRVAQKSNTEQSAEGAKTNGSREESPSEKCGTSTSACQTPATCTTPINKASPICMGDEYHEQSCRKSLSKLSLVKEINDLVPASPGLCGRTKELRKRKNITQIKVLFSQHLDEDVVKQQKKILSRLGGAVVPSMSEATHFVADEFVRTRNMLEAIAFGKPVVTHLWLESCGQANCLIDEKNYILRDAKKEKEFGFCLPVSLSRACQHPLLQGQKVFITPNTKPGKDILVNLVKAVDGWPIERLGRSVLNDENLADNLLILSCEEDYDNCIPVLEKGGAVYSSELLLNGIVRQKLEYERHRLFSDQVKRTRSTLWVKKKNRYLPVTKCK